MFGYDEDSRIRALSYLNREGNTNMSQLKNGSGCDEFYINKMVKEGLIKINLKTDGSSDLEITQKGKAYLIESVIELAQYALGDAWLDILKENYNETNTS